MNQYCVIGNPVAHSKSPFIHEQFANACKRQIQYNKVLVEKGHFSDEVGKMFVRGLHGANVTTPFKEDAFSFCDTVSDRAAAAGAVNTIIRQGESGLLGDNTDGVGLVRDLINNHEITLKARKILIIGAGGASRGILKPILQEEPDSVIIANRTQQKACDLAALFKQYGKVDCCPFTDLKAHSFDVIINASSGSLSGEVPPVPESAMHNDSVLYDLMYANEPTPFLAWGEALGLTQLFDGLGMLVEQAAESFYLWEGVRPETNPVINKLRPRCQ